MKKAAFNVILGGLVLCAAVVVLNRLDAKRPEETYGLEDLPPASLAADNGAYWLLFLGEPEAEGLAIENKIGLYREWLGKLERVERLSWQIPPKTKSLGGRYWQALRDIAFPTLADPDWPGFLSVHGDRLRDLRGRLSVLVARYERMLACETVADFGHDREWDRPYALFSFVTGTARFFSALKIIDGSEGRWDDAVRSLLLELRFGERLAGASQSGFFHTLGRSIADIALEALAGLVNLPGCPDETHEAVFEGLPPLSPERFSARGPLIGDYLWMADRVRNGDRRRQSELALRTLIPGRRGDRIRIAADIMLSRQFGPERYLGMRDTAFELFLMKNRTLGYFSEVLEWLLALDALPPHRWPEIRERPPSFQALRLWWIMNPSGKLLYESVDPVSQRRTVERKYRTRALYDLVRISAGMLSRRSGGEASPAGPAGIESFLSLDPFSGRAYVWDPIARTLRSVGPDGRDDRSVPTGPDGRGDDIVLPMRLF